jgi:uncharacterized protein YcgI (DUF1989 family)
MVVARLRSMDEALVLDLNGKLTQRLRLVSAAVVAARSGWAETVRAGQFLKIVDPNGKQAGDFWAFNAADLDEHLSAMHTRVWVNRLCPRPGESFHTNHRRPILQIVHDTCGVHDLLTAPCDEHRYRLYGVQGEHASCTGNFRQAMAPYLGSGVRFVPQPVNLFMNVSVFPDGRVETGDNPSRPGDCVVFKAWMDSVVALSACPQEFNPVAGWYPTDLRVGIYEAA